jgi:peptidoglycan/LPS O-acetylase OafA/YrhL
VVLANALFAYVTHQWFHTETPSILSVLFYYSNFYSASAAGPLTPKLASGFQHMWSLAFEEQYYLIWPWITVFVLTIRLRLRTVVIIILTLITIVAVHRGILWEEAPRWWSYLYRTDTRADSILWGALFAHIWMRYREPRRWFPIAGWIAAGFLIFVLVFTNEYGPFLYMGGFDGIDIACAIFLLAILDGRWGGRRLFELRPLVAMGTVSYGFYLWHLPVLFAVRYFDAHWNDVVRVVVALSVTMTMTLISWFALERPLMRWSNRMERDRRIKLEQQLAAGRLHSIASGTSTGTDDTRRSSRAAPTSTNVDATGGSDA